MFWCSPQAAEERVLRLDCVTWTKNARSEAVPYLRFAACLSGFGERWCHFDVDSWGVLHFIWWGHWRLAAFLAQLCTKQQFLCWEDMKLQHWQWLKGRAWKGMEGHGWAWMGKNYESTQYWKKQMLGKLLLVTFWYNLWWVTIIYIYNLF